MNREDAKKHFDEKTIEFNLEHTYSFEEAWDFMEWKRLRTSIDKPAKFFPAQYTEQQFRGGYI